MKNRVNVSRL